MEKPTFEKNLIVGGGIDNEMDMIETIKRIKAVEKYDFTPYLKEVEKLTKEINKKIQKTAQKFKVDVLLQNDEDNYQEVLIRFNIDTNKLTID